MMENFKKLELRKQIWEDNERNIDDQHSYDLWQSQVELSPLLPKL